MKIKYIIFIVLFLCSISLINATTITETWGTETFNFGCTNNNFIYTTKSIWDYFDTASNQHGHAPHTFDLHWIALCSSGYWTNYTNVSYEINTQEGMRIHSTLGFPADQLSQLTTYFNDTYVLVNTTEITFYCSNGVDDNIVSSYFALGNNTNWTVSFALSDDYGCANGANAPRNCCENLLLAINDLQKPCDNTTNVNYVNMSWRYIKDFCGITEDYLITSLHLVENHENGVATAVFIDDISITGLVNVSDISLPDGNLLYNETDICLNQELGYVDWNYELNVSSSSNLTMYYSLDNSIYQKTRILYEENFLIDDVGDCGDSADWSFFDSENFISNYSYASSIFEYNSYWLSLSRNFHYLYGDINKYGNCKGTLYTLNQIDEFIIKPDNSFNDDVLINLQYRFLYNINTSTILKDNEFNNIVNVTFMFVEDGEEGILSIYIDGVNVYTENRTTTDYLNLDIIINATTDQINLTFWDIENFNYRFGIENINFNEFTSFLFETDEKENNNFRWELNDIRIWGYNYEFIPVWSSSLPENPLRFNDTTNRYLNFFVTDEYHLNLNEYNTFNVTINILESELCYSSNLDNTNNLFGDYENLHGYTGIRLYLHQILWYFQLGYRFALYYGFINFVYAGVLLALCFLVYELIFEFHYNIKTTTNITYGLMVLLSLLRLMYTPVFIFCTFIFSYLTINEFQDSTELKETKQFIKTYGLFSVILMMLDLSIGLGLSFKWFNRPLTFSLSGILNFFINIIEFVFDILFYTIEGQNLLNIILWVIRIICILELLHYSKKIVNPLSN